MEAKILTLKRRREISRWPILGGNLFSGKKAGGIHEHSRRFWRQRFLRIGAARRKKNRFAAAFCFSRPFWLITQKEKRGQFRKKRNCFRSTFLRCFSRELCLLRVFACIEMAFQK